MNKRNPRGENARETEGNWRRNEGFKRLGIYIYSIY